MWRQHGLVWLWLGLVGRIRGWKLAWHAVDGIWILLSILKYGKIGGVDGAHVVGHGGGHVGKVHGRGHHSHVSGRTDIHIEGRRAAQIGCQGHAHARVHGGLRMGGEEGLGGRLLRCAGLSLIGVHEGLEESG